MQKNLYKSIIYIMTSNILFVLISYVVKLASAVSVSEMTLFRSIIGVLFIIVSIKQKPLNNKGGRLKLLIFRGFLGYLGLQLAFYMMVHMHMSVALTYLKASTIFATIFAVILIKEKISILAIMSVTLGFIGVIIVANPVQIGINSDNIIGLSCALTAGFVYMLVKKLSIYYEPRTIVFSFLIASIVCSSIGMILAEFIEIKGLEFLISKFIIPTPRDTIYLIIIGVLSYYAIIFLTKAFALGDVNFIGTMSYMTIPLAIVLSIIIGADLPSNIEIVGMMIIITSGFMSVKSNSKKKDVH